MYPSRNIIIGCVIVAAVMTAILLSYSPSIAPHQEHHQEEHQQYRNNVNVSFMEYKPSEFEQEWIDNVLVWQDKVCSIIQKQEDKVNQLVNYLDSGIEPPKDRILSRHLYQCENSEIIETVIEPFVGLPLHPKFCWDRELREDRSYIIIDCNITKLLSKHSKIYYFDLGAMNWNGNGNWIYQQYRDCGLSFDGIFAWEGKQIAPRVVWDQIPDEIVHIYHWYNIPYQFFTKDNSNPFVMLQNIATPQDFVIVKMDINSNHVEDILASPNILSLIDEFYFEFHINVEPMNSIWESKELVDTYKYFIPLRRAGIRAHSWSSKNKNER